jgi:hypothetical protein
MRNGAAAQSRPGRWRLTERCFGPGSMGIPRGSSGFAGWTTEGETVWRGLAERMKCLLICRFVKYERDTVLRRLA